MKKEINNELDIPEEDFCQKCGEKMIEEDGLKFCQKCDGEIDFFGDGDED